MIPLATLPVGRKRRHQRVEDDMLEWFPAIRVLTYVATAFWGCLHSIPVAEEPLSPLRIPVTVEGVLVLLPEAEALELQYAEYLYQGWETPPHLEVRRDQAVVYLGSVPVGLKFTDGDPVEKAVELVEEYPDAAESIDGPISLICDPRMIEALRSRPGRRLALDVGSCADQCPDLWHCLAALGADELYLGVGGKDTSYLEGLQNVPGLVGLAIWSRDLDEWDLMAIGRLHDLRALRIDLEEVRHGFLYLLALRRLRVLETEVDSGGAIATELVRTLSMIRSLEFLRIKYDAYAKGLYAAVSELPGLRTLDVEGSKNPGKLANLARSSSLRRLRYDGGRWCDDAELKDICGISQLRSLDLYCDQLTDRGLEHLAALEQLEHLSIIGWADEFGNEGLKALSGLRNLRQLHFPFSNVKDDGMAALGSLVELRSVWHISGREITDRGLSELAKLTSLRSLSLAIGDSTEAGLEVLQGLKELRYLSLSTQGTTFPDLSGLQHLHHLEIWGDDFTGAGLVGLRVLPRLRTLEIANSGFEEENLRHLNDYPALERLHIHRTHWTRTGLESIIELEHLKELRTNVQDLSPDLHSVLRKIQHGTRRWKHLRKHGRHPSDAEPPTFSVELYGYPR